MPSSMCWPAGPSRQCRIVSPSSANQSRRSEVDQTPTLFTQPPRLVLELTSGLTVTTRAAASGASRVRSRRSRPRAAWVVAVPLGVRPMSSGTGGGACGAAAGRRSRFAVSAHRRAAADPSSNRAQGASASAPSRGASSAIWSAVRRDEWFCGWPSLGRPWPLTVYAKITVGLVSSMASNASPRVPRSWPPRLRRAARSVASSSVAIRRATGSLPPGRRSRSSPASQRSRRWYSGLGIASMRARRSSPPGRSNSSVSSRPYFSVSTCQPAAANMPFSRCAARYGTTRSRDCRLRSTIHTTSPSSATPGSRIASQTAPSSSSASPTREYCRPAGAPSTYRRATAPQIGAVAPMPTDPVE